MVASTTRHERPVGGRDADGGFADLGPGRWRRRLVVVPVGRFDLRAAEAVAHSRRVPAGEHRALHVVSDGDDLWELGRDWMGGRAGLPLYTVEDEGGVPRTLARAVRSELGSEFDEVVVVVGRLWLRRRAHRLLHDRTADAIARALRPLPRVRGAVMTPARPFPSVAAPNGQVSEPRDAPRRGPHPSGPVPIAAVRWRQRVVVEGRVRTVRVQPLAGTSTLECFLEDDSGAMSVVFLGRPPIAGIEVGTWMRVAGPAGQHRGVWRS